MDISFFISRERLIPSMSNKMSTWREKLFVAMQKTNPVTDFYNISSNRIVELGSQIEIRKIKFYVDILLKCINKIGLIQKLPI